MECVDYDKTLDESQYGSGKRRLSSDSKGGIDWSRYNKLVLEKKLLPFALECMKDRPNTIVQENNASPHAHWYQQITYNVWEVQRMI